jgi:endoglucanase
MISRRGLLRGALGTLAGMGSAGPAAGAPAAGGAVRVDQLGYRPGDRKVALVVDRRTRFTVVEARRPRVVFEGLAAPAPSDAASGDRVGLLDFTALTTAGEYVVTAVGARPSPPFRIGPDVYDGALRSMLDSFRWQRCGAALGEDQAWAHPRCHPRDATLWGRAGDRDVTGGWHDAGDYGKYVPSAAYALWHLFGIQRQAGLGGSALLTELRWELDWLLRMQRDDGGVHHKVAPARWTGDRPPHEDREPRYLFDVSSAATADLAAAAAAAVPLFERADPGYARRLLAHAEAAWRWLGRHPAPVPPGGFRNPPGADGGSGAYADDDDRDERFWAAVELWRATGEAGYRTAVLGGLRALAPFQAPPSWRQVQDLACLDLLEPGTPLPAAMRADLAARLAAHARRLVSEVEAGGYRVALAPHEYYWGSNGLALERAVQFLTAHRETADVRYYDAALDQVHYVLGRNALGKCFVTGLGADPPRRPYHQPSLTNPRRLVLPGLVVGGPNGFSNRLPVAVPARAYRDDDRLYEVNEPSIYWTAVLAHVLAALPPSAAADPVGR